MPARSNITLSTATSELRLGGAPLTLRVSARARRLSLRLDRRGGGLTLTVPRGVSQRRALAWAGGQEQWARGVIAAVPALTPIAPGAEIMLRGVPHRIAWAADRSRRISVADQLIRCGGPVDGLEGRLVRWLKAEALALLDAETRDCAARAGLAVQRVAVGDAKSRWGSCSSGGDIRYSWRLIMAPDFVRRATVAHEVAHLKHMDHGPRFHALAAELYGADPAPAREWLRREGASLHRVGA